MLPGDVSLYETIKLLFLIMVFLPTRGINPPPQKKANTYFVLPISLSKWQKN